ncbi:MAG TPA: GntR family transcriptional regulator [Candidatus Limnocylindrales bacterium]|jgi:GntR family transcriptional regulator|nr:GntR family transcriptional regulator [Candidatus Limnocylindrales bacterium]
MRQLESDIATGRLTPGERLAPERQLGARLDVARNTLRRALTDLAARGLLVSRDRSGWFVNGGPVTIETVSGPQGLTDWAAIHGLAVSSKVCAARVRPASDAEARALRIPLDSNVFELERVRIVEGAPLSLDLSVLAPRFAGSLAEVDFSGSSLYQTLRTSEGIEPSRAECMLRAVVADQRSADLLGLAAGVPLLELSETVFDQTGQPFELGRHLNRGDRYAFRTTILAGGVWEGPKG